MACVLCTVHVGKMSFVWGCVEVCGRLVMPDLNGSSVDLPSHLLA
jgi:hypothetical protein